MEDKLTELEKKALQYFKSKETKFDNARFKSIAIIDWVAGYKAAQQESKQRAIDFANSTGYRYEYLIENLWQPRDNGTAILTTEKAFDIFIKEIEGK